ncbi:MAG: Tetratricopeptide repeat-containing protein [Gemmatimonadetes bacterium]|nr:Tetratricopeptide repeat-containing protein [Gemmatimonadota bacterium]
MRRWTSVAPVLLLASAGCLASKSDIRLIQDELRATRAQVAVGDTSIMRADDARRNQIAQLSASIDRMNDSLRVLSRNFSVFQATVNGELDAMGRQMIQFQALLGQTTRNVQDTRAQLEALREQGISNPASAPPSAAPTDTTRRPPPGTPGPATLFTTAIEQLKNGNYRTARAGFDQLLSSYPDFDRAPLAQLRVGETYKGEGNAAAADSVYQLLANRYPKSPEAGTALYLHGKTLWEANKKSEARIVLNRVIRDFPGSDAAQLASDLLNGR